MTMIIINEFIARKWKRKQKKKLEKEKPKKMMNR